MPAKTTTSASNSATESQYNSPNRTQNENAKKTRKIAPKLAYVSASKAPLSGFDDNVFGTVATTSAW